MNKTFTKFLLFYIINREQFVVMPETSIKIQLNGVCKSLAFSKHSCSKLIDAYSGKVRDFVVKQLNPSLCFDFKTCGDDLNGTAAFNQNFINTNVEGIFCDGCHLIASFIQ